MQKISSLIKGFVCITYHFMIRKYVKILIRSKNTATEIERPKSLYEAFQIGHILIEDFFSRNKVAINISLFKIICK